MRKEGGGTAGLDFPLMLMIEGLLGLSLFRLNRDDRIERKNLS